MQPMPPPEERKPVFWYFFGTAAGLWILVIALVAIFGAGTFLKSFKAEMDKAQKSARRSTPSA
jgi:hypothetical protein